MTRPRNAAGLVAGLAATMILAAGCGGSTTTAPGSPAPTAPPATTAPATAAPTPDPTATPPAATPAPGGAVIAGGDAGFVMPLAEGWIVLPLDGGSAAILALLPEGSQLRGVVEAGLEPYLEAGLSGWAIDGTAEAGAVTPNVNLLVREGLEIPDLDTLAAAVADELAATPGLSEITMEVVELPIGPAALATYRGLGEGDDALAEGIQYAIPSGDQLLILSFTIPVDDPVRAAAVEAMVAAISTAR